MSSPNTSRVAQPIRARAGFFRRFRTMARMGLAMMWHDKAKLIGTMLGVVFAVISTNQAAGVLFGLLQKNTMFIEHAGADLWVTPPETKAPAGGKVISTSALSQARVVDGVAWAEPLLYGTAVLKLPGGGTEAVTVIGAKYPRYAGGPWNLVRGNKRDLSRPDTMIFEDSQREMLGGLNIGSVREVNGRSITVGGFTWGLVPFGPSYAFADFELARELFRQPRDQVSYVLVKAKSGADIDAVKADLQKRIPNARIMTTAEFKSSTNKRVLTETSIGESVGTSALFGLIVGFAIVSLMMFSNVLDHIREFGTLKAVGARNLDLAMLLFVQATTFGVIGSIIGIAAIGQIAKLIKSSKMALIMPPEVTFGSAAAIVVMCMMAASFALIRIRRVEPAMVFR